VQVSDLGEFGLIQRLAAHLPSRPDVVLPTGDDASLVDLGAAALLVATVDALVDGRHFLRAVATPEEIGHKALAVNLSDIAAMGAEPLWALVSLLVSPATDVALLDGIYAGMAALAESFAVAIVGGNVVSTSGPLTLDVTLLGRVQRHQAVLRSGARQGDVLCVTGSLGAAAAGLLLATTDDLHIQISPELREAARKSLVSPTPRVREGQILARGGAVTAMIDISDGLAADLGHLCAASGVGALLEVERIPVHPAAAQVAFARGQDAVLFALAGGEDYELLFSVPPDGLDAALRMVGEVGGEAHRIGTITNSAGTLGLKSGDGTISPLDAAGWDHLRAAR